MALHRPGPYRLLLVAVVLLTAITSSWYLYSRGMPSTFSVQNTGYVLALNYSDQLRAGSVNVFSLQCWASTLNEPVKVVQPFIHMGSRLGLDLSITKNNICNHRHEHSLASATNDLATLHNIFDAGAWTKVVVQRNYSMLVPWEEFLKTAPRKLILVDHYCMKVCQSFKDVVAQSVFKDMFDVVREVCTSDKNIITSEEFKELVYGDYRPHETVVLFKLWGGIGNDPTPHGLSFRIGLSNLKRCERFRNMIYIQQSQRLAETGRKYIYRYLKSSSGYIAVMFRLEKLYVRQESLLQTKERSIRIARVMECISSILSKIRLLKSWNRITKVFLTMDVGKHGSAGFKKLRFFTEHASEVNELSQHLFYGIYPNGSLSYKEWEESFESVVDFNISGYIAMTQLNVAARAKYLLLAGKGSSFQDLASKMYMGYQYNSFRKPYYFKEC